MLSLKGAKHLICRSSEILQALRALRMTIRELLMVAVFALTACAATLIPEAPPAQRETPTPQVVIAVVGSSPTPMATRVTEVAPTPPYELGAGQHISSSGSYRDNETETAGPMACRIERYSPAFYQLVSSYDSRVLWSDGEQPPYNDEDHMMHPAMLDPFVKLIDLVQAEWGGETQIMVTETYDSLLDHNLAQQNRNLKYSLHFEGRSIDMVPWPPDSTRVGRLCALAHIAGFDWVHNEDDHCHATVTAQSLCELYDYRAKP